MNNTMTMCMSCIMYHLVESYILVQHEQNESNNNTYVYMLIYHSSLLRSLATKYSKTPQQVFFKFVQSLGITPLTGTTSSIHMAEDLATLDFVIDSEDVNAISKFMKI